MIHPCSRRVCYWRVTCNRLPSGQMQPSSTQGGGGGGSKWPHIVHLRINCQCANFVSESDRAVILVVRSTWKSQDINWNLAFCQVSLNSTQQFQSRSRKCLSQLEAGLTIFFPDRPEKHKLGRGHWDLASCQVWSFIEFRSVVSEEKSKRSQPIRGKAAILFSDRLEKHKLDRRR